MLSKLLKENIPHDFYIKSKGINVKYPGKKNNGIWGYAIIDSEGYENPFLYDYTTDSKTIKERINSQTITEDFIQNFIIKKSNILIITLGILSYNELKLLNRIKSKLRKKAGIQYLYVIHNLQTFSLKSQVQHYIDNTLLKSGSFKLKEMKFIRLDIDLNNNNNYTSLKNRIK